MSVRNYILFIITLYILIGCESSWTPELENSDPKFYVLCELNADKIPSAQVVTTSGFSNGDSPSQPVGDEVTVLVEYVDANGDVKTSRLTNNTTNQSPGMYVNSGGDLMPRLQPGRTFDFKVFATPGEEKFSHIDEINATTTIPFVKELKDIQVIDKTDYSSVDKIDFKFEVALQLPDPENEDVFYQVVPQVQLNQGSDYVNINKDIEGKITIPLEFYGVDEFVQKNGIFIDYNKLETDVINFNIDFSLTADKFNTEINNINFVLNTVSRDCYIYHQRISDQHVSSQFSSSFPVVDYSNVDGGAGLFSSFSTSSKQVYF